LQQKNHFSGSNVMGFRMGPLPDHPLALFLPLPTLAAAVEALGG
jgi:hypothetical protein